MGLVTDMPKNADRIDNIKSYIRQEMLTTHPSVSYTHLPIIALTAFAYDHDRKAALEAGCNDFLTKPFTQEKLKETIKKWVNK